MMGLPKWLRSREHDYAPYPDHEVHVPQIAKVEPLMMGPRKGGINPPPENFVRPNAPPPFHIDGSAGEHEANIVVQAHQFVEQWKATSAEQRKTIDCLQAELEDTKQALKSEQRKSGLLELDVAERDNTIQTLQSQVEDDRRFMSILKDIIAKANATFERLGVKDLPKKERKPKEKKHAQEVKAKKESADRKGADQTAGTNPIDPAEKSHAI
jgi:hypothetical protein